jgi:poly-gamma-glutamate capsule biosynthesis protein CapA/YwtB (metallophosphatase superfamily)
MHHDLDGGVNSEMITILIGSDICPSRADLSLFIDSWVAEVFHDLLEDFLGADLSIVNLECPLTDRMSPIIKNGPKLAATVAALGAIRSAGIDVLNLAINHILDHDTGRLESPIRASEAAGIVTVGAGRDLKEARRILIRPIGGIRVGILGVAEHEFSISTATSPGANPFDLIDIIRNIEVDRKNIDYLIVLLHGGNKNYPFPCPRFMKTCRFLVEQGVNAVICQHSQRVGCFEDYRGGHIV